MERTAVRGRLTWQTAAVTSVTRETASVVTIQLDPPDWPDHRAGQHLEVRLTADDGYQAEREYSIASAPGEPLAITVERLEGGEVSPYLTEEFRAGDELGSGQPYVVKTARSFARRIEGSIPDGPSGFSPE